MSFSLGLLACSTGGLDLELICPMFISFNDEEGRKENIVIMLKFNLFITKKMDIIKQLQKHVKRKK